MSRTSKKKMDDHRHEALGILIIFFALLVFLGLVSHNYTDYPNSGSPSHVRNWLGLAGATISYYLFVYTIGYASLIFPLMVFLLGWNIFLQRDYRSFFRVSLYLLALGLFLSTTLAMPEVVSSEGSKYGFRLSGLLGGFFAEQLNRYLGTAGSIVVLLAFLLTFLVSATSWSMRETLVDFKEGVMVLFRGLTKKRERINVKKPPVFKESESPQEIPEQRPRPTNEFYNCHEDTKTRRREEKKVRR